MDPLTLPLRAGASLGGQALRAATSAVAALRPTAKPLHPDGAVMRARLERHGSTERSGSPWLDGTGDDEVLARQSRAVGLAAPAPDIFGLALRIPLSAERYGDLLLATTGLGRLTRFTLTAGRTPYHRPLTTLLPYRTPSGPVLVAAVHHDVTTVDLSWARVAGHWHRFGRLTLDHHLAVAHDAPVSFDPVRNHLPGLENYPWVRALREPSYLAARRSRSEGARRPRS